MASTRFGRAAGWDGSDRCDRSYGRVPAATSGCAGSPGLGTLGTLGTLGMLGTLGTLGTVGTLGSLGSCAGAALHPLAGGQVRPVTLPERRRAAMSGRNVAGTAAGGHVRP